MENGVNANRLTHANLVGRSIVKCDEQKCATCVNERYDCVKLVMPGGQICIWE